MIKELYIEDQLVKLGDQTNIALTFQINSTGELQNRQSNHSNQFKIPFCPENDFILGFSNDLKSGSDKPYRKLTAKYIEDGIEIISPGFAIIEESLDHYAITVYCGNIDFFELIDGLKLSDLSLSDLNHIWDPATIQASALNDEGYIYPIIDYGELLDSEGDLWPLTIATTGTVSTLVGAEGALYPALFCKTLMERIADEQGFTIEGNVLDDETYTKLLLAWSAQSWKKNEQEVEDSQTSVNADYVNASVGIIQTFVLTPLGGNNIDDAQYECDLHATLIPGSPRYEYIVPVTRVVDIKASVTVTHTIYPILHMPPTGVINYDVIDYSTDSILATVSASITGAIIPNFTDEQLNIEATGITITAGNTIGLRLRAAYFVNDGEFSIKAISFQLGMQDALAFGDEVIMIDQVPDMTQKEFFKGIMNVFGICPEVKNWNKTIKFRSFNELKTNIETGNVKDWSSLYVENPNDSLQYRFGDYGQTNECIYQLDDGVTDRRGWGTFNVDDETLERLKTVIELPFGSSDTVKRLGYAGDPPGQYSMPLIDKIDPNLTAVFKINDSKNVSPRIVRLKRGDATYPFNAGFGWTDNPFCIFDDGSEDSLSFENLLIKYYPITIQSLVKAKKIPPQFRLTAQHVQNFDHFIPIFISKFAAYFYVNKISNYKSGELTTVELIRL